MWLRGETEGRATKVILIRCYITDRTALPSDTTLLQTIARNLESGPDWIQIREKDLMARELLELTRNVLALPNPRGVKILVNSRVDVAVAAGAAGAHLPAGSPGPVAWRAIVPSDFLIGVSCHSLAEIRTAAEEGANYVLFGPVFQPLSKPAGLPPLGLEGLARAAESVEDPGAGAGRNHCRERGPVRGRRSRQEWPASRSSSGIARIATVAGFAPRQAYSREETRRLLNISERRLKGWERQKLVSPCETYGFRELVALRTLERLRSARVAPAQIRRALAALAEKLSHIQDPLTQLKLYADGKKIRVEVEGRAMEAESGQLLLDFDPVELNRLLEFRGKDTGQAEREKKAEAERWFQRGLELEQTGGPSEEVIEAYRKSLELDPRSAGALVNLGTIYFNAREWKQAERYYQQALEADPGVLAGALRPGQSLR